MIIRFILFALLAYIIYKLVFVLILPIIRATHKIRRQFSDMQQHMQDQASNHPQNGHTSQPPPVQEQKKAARAGDYIDFEEVK
ncbi:MAG: hypothetical protein ABI813_06510 [Bacteroidota bacterium]